MAGPVLHGPDQRPRLAEIREKLGDDLTVGEGVRPRDVVDLARRPAAQNVVDRRGVVRHKEPVADLHPVSVERERLVVERIRDEQRDQLLGMVVRPVRVGAAGDHDVQPVGRVVAARQELAGGLRGGVGRPRRERIALARAALLDGPVDLVRGDLEQARRDRAVPGDRSVPLPPDGLQEHMHAVHPGPQEGGRVEDGPVDVRLGGEVDDRVGIRDERPHRRSVRDVAAHEGEARRLLRVGLHGREVRAVAGIGQLVEDGDARAVTSRQEVANVAAADEASSTGDEEPRAGTGSGHAEGRWGGGASSPASSAAEASSAARSSEATVPASAQAPSKRRANSRPPGM